MEVITMANNKKKFDKVLVIGSGPIVIGQAAEFDYSGTQACQILKEEGIHVVLVNSNPATIMTDRTIADSVYIEPLTVEFVEKIIVKEQPDAVLVGMGGQTALNLALELDAAGILKKHNVQIIGSNVEAIEKSEDREMFKAEMVKIGQPVIESAIAETYEEAEKIALRIGLPIVVRPAFTLGGTGGGFAYTIEELKEIVPQGLSASAVSQVLIEKSIKGWKEIEYEMMRDSEGNTISVCNMENFDPVGIHTGDSIVVAPSQTLTDKEYQLLRRASIDIVSALDIQGGCNVQLALDPLSFEYRVIEVNPRVSRSSALASKATGYPIAKVATKIALGYTLDQITNDVTGVTKACFEPTLDYCALKIPKWPFDKFQEADKTLGTRMMATGEIMSLANNFESALLKGIRSLEVGLFGLDYAKAKTMILDELFEKIDIADDERLFYLAELIRREVSILKLAKVTKIDLYFLDKLKIIVDLEESIRNKELASISAEQLKLMKVKGFSDKQISDLLLDGTEDEVRAARLDAGIKAVYKMVDTCGGEFEATSPYYYSTYDQFNECEVSEKRKIMIVGSGPIRIGQGVEFDYCSVHGVMALKNEGIEAIIVNNNPETVSTDFDISDKLYFEPITNEDVMNIIELEKPEGVILQYGGQTAIKLADYLHNKGVKILGTSFENINNAEDRGEFNNILLANGLARPEGEGVFTLEEGLALAEKLGYPVLIRPSYVIGGMGMEIVYNKKELEHYLVNAIDSNTVNPVLIDKYLVGKEIEVDAITDGNDILIPGIMEHLERAGVHSGDSISIYPTVSISNEIKKKILEMTKVLAKSLKAVGLINIQFVLADNEVYVIEVNPRASRTVPFISKVTNIPMIELSTKVILGKKLKDLGYGIDLALEKDFTAIKYPVFSMEKIPQTEIALGPEMKSTGEAMSIERDFDRSFYKGLVAINSSLPKVGKVLMSIAEPFKEESIKLAEDIRGLGYELYATAGTKQALDAAGLSANEVTKIGEAGTDIISLIKSSDVEMVINIPSKGKNAKTDGFKIRRAAIEAKTMCLTSLDTAKAIVDLMKKELVADELEVFDICDIK